MAAEFSGLRAVADVSAVIDVEDVHGAGAFVDPVDDPVGAPAGAVAAGEGPEERLADAVRADRERGIAELEYRGCHGFGQPRYDRAPGGGLEPDVVPLGRLRGHVPVARRLARSWRTVARSAPGSPRPSAARLSEMRATVPVSPRISKVIS